LKRISVLGKEGVRRGDRFEWRGEVTAVRHGGYYDEAADEEPCEHEREGKK
jgi:hypothetical protein